MTTNIHYLIAAMAVLLVVIWQYSRQRQMDDRNSLMFRRLLSIVSLDVAAELVSTAFILYAPYSFGVGRMLSNTVFYLFQALLPLLLLYYVCTLCTSRVIAPSVVLRMGIPTIALVFIILTNPFTEILFYFDSTGYRHGPWYLLLYVSALLHIAGAAVFVAVHRASVSRRTLTELLAVFALAALGIAAQAVNPSVLTTGFGLSLSILAMYLTINNPCACMDSLTGLNDKQYLLRRMDELTDAHKAFHIITVYAYQLDHMNKVSGVQSGDEFLRRAAEHMQEIAGRNVFRVTGKRFLLLTFSLREYEACLTSLRQVFRTQPDDEQAAPSPVILCGVVGAEKLGTGGLVLDYAEYLESLAARRGGTEVIQNDRKNRDSFYYNKQVEQFLHRAIDEDLFEVYYQPVYSLHQQRFVTLEALSRLRHPELGWISPDIFIRLAEKNHLITQITELQLRRVCRFLCENPALRASIANVKINLSPLDLIQSESGSHLVRILGEYGLPCSCFQFEITETVATEYSASLTRVAESLQTAGIGLCLDDFGSGYANLNTVMQLPFSVIKLDRSLLFHICTDKNAAVTFRIVNGTWSGGAAEDKTVSVVLYPQADGTASGTLDASYVPQIMLPAPGYENTAGGWEQTPNTDPNGITGDVTYVYRFGSTGGGSSSGHSTRYTLHYESNGGTTYKDERCSSGTKVTLDKTPTRESYTFTGWYADKALTQKITTVTMNSDKTVYAGWEATGVPDKLNGDDHFAYVIGYPDGKVHPEGNISRAETATIFFRLLKADIRDGNLTADNDFSDVSDGQWHNKAISTMAKLGIVKGRRADSFDPDASITRAEFAAICARFNTKPVENSGSFSDISGHWAENEIERAAAFGWISGYPDGTFRPDARITRAEAMTMINRVLCRMPQSESDLLDSMVTWPDNKPSDWHYLAVQEATNSHDFNRQGEVGESWTKLTSVPDWTRYQ